MEPSFTQDIEKASTADARAVLGVLVTCATWLSEHGKDHWVNAFKLEAIEKDIKNGDVLVNRTADGAIRGTVTLARQEPPYYTPAYQKIWSTPDQSSAFIKKLAVLPEFHQTGVASKLLEYGENVAKLQGITTTRMDLNPNVPELVPFYEKRGYRLLGRIDGNFFLEKQLTF